MKRTIYDNKIFDFEIGYLIKSPCRDCTIRFQFPGCMHSCQVLDKVQRTLATGISSTKSPSRLEPFAILLENRPEKK